MITKICNYIQLNILSANKATMFCQSKSRERNSYCSICFCLQQTNQLCLGHVSLACIIETSTKEWNDKNPIINQYKP